MGMKSLNIAPEWFVQSVARNQRGVFVGSADWTLAFMKSWKLSEGIWNLSEFSSQDSLQIRHNVSLRRRRMFRKKAMPPPDRESRLLSPRFRSNERMSRRVPPNWHWDKSGFWVWECW